MAHTPEGNWRGFKEISNKYATLLRLCGHPQLLCSSYSFPFVFQFMSGTTKPVDLITDSHPGPTHTIWISSHSEYRGINDAQSTLGSQYCSPLRALAGVHIQTRPMPLPAALRAVYSALLGILHIITLTSLVFLPLLSNPTLRIFCLGALKFCFMVTKQPIC